MKVEEEYFDVLQNLDWAIVNEFRQDRSILDMDAREAVVVPVPVRDNTRTVEIPWTYAYFEIAERPFMKNPVTGQMERFEGFLGGQATHLFEMTKLKQ